MRPPSPVAMRNVDPSVYEPWQMNERERYLATKCIKLIQGRIPSKVIYLKLIELYKETMNNLFLGKSITILH